LAALTGVEWRVSNQLAAEELRVDTSTVTTRCQLVDL